MRPIFGVFWIMFFSLIADAAPIPNELSEAQKVAIRKAIPPDYKFKTGTPPVLVGRLIHCAPYCEEVAKVYANDPAQYQDSIQIEKIDASNPAPIKSLRFMDLKVSLTGKSEAPEDQVKVYDQLAPRYYLFKQAGIFGFGGRGWSTSANNEQDIGASTLFAVGGELSVRTPAFFYITQYAPIFDLSYHLLHSFGEKVSAQDSTRTTNALHWELDVRGLLFARPDPMMFSLIGAYRQYSLNTSPATSRGFSFLDTEILLGIGAKVTPYIQVDVLKSISGSSVDAVQTRGTAVNSSMLSLRVTGCQAYFDTPPYGVNFCVFGNVDLWNQTGQGTPVQPIYTQNPSYSSVSWMVGIKLELTERWTLKKSEPEAEEDKDKKKDKKKKKSFGSNS